MEVSQTPAPRRKLDVASLALMLIGLASGALALWLVITTTLNIAVVVPAVVATAIGARHLTKLEAPRP